MIKATTSKVHFNKNQLCDFGMQSLLSIIKHYKTNATTDYLSKMINNKARNQSNTFLSLNKVAKQYGLLSVVCNDIDIKTIIEYNQPIIVNIACTDRHNHFVVCYGYDEQEGFSIFDPKNGHFLASISGFESIWSDDTCMAFSNN